MYGYNGIRRLAESTKRQMATIVKQEFKKRRTALRRRGEAAIVINAEMVPDEKRQKCTLRLKKALETNWSHASNNLEVERTVKEIEEKVFENATSYLNYLKRISDKIGEMREMSKEGSIFRLNRGAEEMEVDPEE